MADEIGPESLRAHLQYEPLELRFGTSGRRGEVVHLTQLEVYINACAELQYLLSLPVAGGGISRGDTFYYASDLRPSSTNTVQEHGGRGCIAQAIERAIRDTGLLPVNLGRIPTPALALYAIQRHCGSTMITGSHIPFDRNGYKLNTSRGELLKKDEEPISRCVDGFRRDVYARPFASSLFNEQGMLKTGHSFLTPEITDARDEYIQRYCEFFDGRGLEGRRIVLYQHSAVGRDILRGILELLGAIVEPVGRSETFIPIDTENISTERLAAIQILTGQAIRERGPVDAVVSTDGDSDRPLVLGVGPNGRAHFYGGDLVGMVAAEFLGADSVVVPISCNDAIDRGPLKDLLEPRTRIGSPFVIAGMEKARARGKRAVCGWEANGGFLTGSDIQRNGRVLPALPTRDAILPILCVLLSAFERGLSLIDRFALLPARYSRAALLRDFPRTVSSGIVARFCPEVTSVVDVSFANGGVAALDEEGALQVLSSSQIRALEAIRDDLARFFTADSGFASIAQLNYTDGIRAGFDNGEIVHVRPSGNADELRIYAVANTQLRADAIASLGIAEPEGILRRMQRTVTGCRP